MSIATWWQAAGPLTKGTIKTAIASGTAVVTGLPVVDNDHFSPMTLHGIGRLAIVLAWVIFVAECRYWNAWASKTNGNGNGGTP